MTSNIIYFLLSYLTLSYEVSDPRGHGLAALTSRLTLLYSSSNILNTDLSQTTGALKNMDVSNPSEASEQT